MPTHDPFVDVLREWAGVFMRRSMRHLIHYARASGLSMSQIGAMFHLRQRDGCGVTDLGEYLGVTSAAASQMLERLVQQALILRQEDPNDRRVKQLVLTDKGEQVLQDFIHARQDWLSGLAEILTAGEKEQVALALNILIEKTRQLEPLAESEN